MIVILIAYILALIFITRCLILIFICDYKMWKQKKEDEKRYRQVEDKFKDRKLTD